jgi:hypothetical protein
MGYTSDFQAVVRVPLVVEGGSSGGRQSYLRIAILFHTLNCTVLITLLELF